MPVAYGLGRFWCDLPDLDVHANDLHPDKGDTSHDFTDTPWPDRWWPCVVFDPPYRIGGTPSTPEFDDAYGIEVPRPAAEVRALIEDGTREAVRLSSEFVLVKVQDHVSSGRLQPLTKWVTEVAETAGARLVDSAHVEAGRAQPIGTRQVRFRHGYSTLLVMPRERGRASC
jgi:hypothetical protein